MSLLSTLALGALTSYGSIKNNVNVGPGASVNMDISSNWNGAINIGTGCNSVSSCTTGGPTWSGVTPFSRVEFNFVRFQLEQLISMIQHLPLLVGHPCGGALPAWGGGCVNNTGPGSCSSFYYGTCYNTYAFPDNDSASRYKPANIVDYTCHNTTIILMLCPSIMSNYH
ncbi:hypothetical protein HD554DRAFT_2042804 [Boletus coccyginus]|nr:hypothetical protein HD554DRAFT_2042804 [Boletus coccyginus]